MRLKPDGTAPVYSALLDAYDVYALTVDPLGRAIAAGTRGSLSSSHSPLLGSSAELNRSYGFITALNPDGTAPDYSFSYPASSLTGIAREQSGTLSVVGLDRGNLLISKVDPALRTLQYVMSMPAWQLGLRPAIALQEGRIAFGGWSRSPVIPVGSSRI